MRFLSFLNRRSFEPKFLKLFCVKSSSKSNFSPSTYSTLVIDMKIYSLSSYSRSLSPAGTRILLNSYSYCFDFHKFSKFREYFKFSWEIFKFVHSFHTIAGNLYFYEKNWFIVIIARFLIIILLLLLLLLFSLVRIFVMHGN